MVACSDRHRTLSYQEAAPRRRQNHPFAVCVGHYKRILFAVATTMSRDLMAIVLNGRAGSALQDISALHSGQGDEGERKVNLI